MRRYRKRLGLTTLGLKTLVLETLVLAPLLGSTPALAWGDEGHEVIARIAQHFLEPGVERRVQALLAADDSGLTAHDMAHEATWADKYRDSDRDTARVRYLGTRDWHFVDLELAGPDLAAACSGRPALAPDVDASQGPAHDCVVDKIDQFRLELSRPATGERERRLALQYLLHFVGDLHQPLHASDDHDQGGNSKLASAAGMAGAAVLAPVPLHRLWDVDFVARLGPDPEAIAGRLLASVTAAERARWSTGAPEDWAFETFALARSSAYGQLPPADGDRHYTLSAAYVDAATAATAIQLEKAGVRLAWLLNMALH